jgi:hypothetical protein
VLFANGLELYHPVLSVPAYAFNGLNFKPSPKSNVSKLELKQGSSVVHCTLQATFHGTLQANLVFAAMQNKDFKYQDLYVSIFYMDFQIFIVIVYAFRCVVIKKYSAISFWKNMLRL